MKNDKTFVSEKNNLSRSFQKIQEMLVFHHNSTPYIRQYNNDGVLAGQNICPASIRNT